MPSFFKPQNKLQRTLKRTKLSEQVNLLITGLQRAMGINCRLHFVKDQIAQYLPHIKSLKSLVLICCYLNI